jgi:hypothetical protein
VVEKEIRNNKGHHLEYSMMWGAMNELCDQKLTASLIHKAWTLQQYGGTNYDSRS